MRKNILFTFAAACAVALTIPCATLQAQTTNALGVTIPAQSSPPRPNPQARLFSVRSAIMSLDRVMLDLKRSSNDFDGHKQSAIDACVKTREELMAVAKAAGIPIPPPRLPGQRPMGVPPPGSAVPRPAAPPQPAAPTQ
jgi:hypothetical protein